MHREIDPTEDGDRDNPVAAAVDRLRASDAESDAAPARRGRGRPRGSRTRKRGRSSSAPRPPAAPAAPLVEGVAEPTEAETRMLGKLLGTAWRMIARRVGHRELDPQEQLELAEAAHPVLVKYGAQWGGQYAAEIGLALTAWGLWEVTAPAPVPPSPDATGGPASAELEPAA